MAREEIKYRISLETAPAQDGAKRLTDNILKLKSALEDTKNVVDRTAGTFKGGSLFEGLKASGQQLPGWDLDQLRRAMRNMGGEADITYKKFAGLGNAFSRAYFPATVLRHIIGQTAAGFNQLRGAITSGNIAGAISGVGQSIAGMSTALDLALPGLGQVSSAIIRTGTGIISTMTDIAQSAIVLSMDVVASNRRMAASFEALGAPGAGQKTLDFINRLATQLPQSREQITEWVKQFEAFGIVDLGQLRQQIRATAAAQAILGEQGANTYKDMAEKINDAVRGHHALRMQGMKYDPLQAIAKSGANAELVAKKLGLTIQQLDSSLKAGQVDAQKLGNALSSSLIERGAGPIQALGNTIDTLGTKLMETFRHMFDGIDISPITDGIKSVIFLGEMATGTGGALKSQIGGAMQEVINWVGRGIIQFERFFTKLELDWAVQGNLIDRVTSALGGLSEKLETIANTVVFLGKAFGYFKDMTDFVDSNLAKLPGLALQTFNGPLPAGGEGGMLDFRPKVAPGNALGGTVMRPAPGESFASVKPGEHIIPERDSRLLTRGGIGPIFMNSMRYGAPDNEEESGIQINSVEVNINAPEGVTDAIQLSATGLSLALERQQLMSGR